MKSDRHLMNATPFILFICLKLCIHVLKNCDSEGEGDNASFLLDY